MSNKFKKFLLGALLLACGLVAGQPSLVYLGVSSVAEVISDPLDRQDVGDE